jgi:hypothetical protein
VTRRDGEAIGLQPERRERSLTHCVWVAFPATGNLNETPGDSLSNRVQSGFLMRFFASLIERPAEKRGRFCIETLVHAERLARMGATIIVLCCIERTSSTSRMPHEGLNHRVEDAQTLLNHAICVSHFHPDDVLFYVKRHVRCRDSEENLFLL